jgi:hypothetical protein
MSDFEMAVKNALEEIFHERLVWNGCYFHLSQAIQRKIQSLGLSTDYNDKNTLFSILIKKNKKSSIPSTSISK